MTLKEYLQNYTTIEIYEMVLNKEISRFPEHFWTGEEGKQRGLECFRYLLFTKLKWKKEDLPKNFSKKVITSNKLGGMLAQCFDNSPMKCILELMGDMYQPWEYKVAPTNYWNRETAKEATLFMLNKLNWSDEDIKSNLSMKTFKDFGLASMMGSIYNSSPYKAIEDIFPGKFKEWELKNVPLSFWNEDTCTEALLWFVENKLPKNFRNLPCEDVRNIMVENGLGYVIHTKFKNNIKNVIALIDKHLDETA